MTTADRIAMIRAAHRRYLVREHAADRFARTIAPHLRDDTPLALDHDALDELDTSTVRLRGCRVTQLTLVPASAHVPTWAPFALARLNLAEKWARVCGANAEAVWISAKPWATYAESERAWKAYFRAEGRKKAAAAMSPKQRGAAMFAAFPWSNTTFRMGRAVVCTSVPNDSALLTAEIITENAHSLAMVAGVDLAVLERWVLTGEVTP